MFIRLITTTMYTGKLQKGDTLEIERNYEFDKKGIEIIKVVWIFQQGKTRYALLDNGMKHFILPPMAKSTENL